MRPTDIWPSGTGGFIVEPRGEDFVVAAGDDELEAGAALALDVDDDRARGQRLRRRAATSRPLPTRCCAAWSCTGAHAALSSARKAAGGGFAGLAAGLAYSNPPRTYYRDGYWTLQLLARLAPDIAAAEIELLAELPSRPTARRPSAVIVSGRHADDVRAPAPGASRRWPPPTGGPGEWWSDHFDSPLFFVLAVAEHVGRERRRRAGRGAIGRSWRASSTATWACAGRPACR